MFVAVILCLLTSNFLYGMSEKRPVVHQQKLDCSCKKNKDKFNAWMGASVHVCNSAQLLVTPQQNNVNARKPKRPFCGRFLIFYQAEMQKKYLLRQWHVYEQGYLPASLQKNKCALKAIIHSEE
ncbi:MAG: hypothetical protein ACOYT8_03845 [Candidatus Dependentiae bacterium]